MKNWLLYFFCLLLVFALLPIAASKTVAARKTPFVTFCSDGNINNMSVEEYTLRVLISEGEDLAKESKKALAVSIRSIAVYASLYGLKHDDFSFCSDVNCCFSLEEAENYDSAYVEECKNAVDETYGLILSDGKYTALALFTRCAGSGTRSNSEIPYLVSVSEPDGCLIHINEKILPISILGYGAKEDSCIVYEENKKCAFGIFGGRAIDSSTLVSLLGLPSPEITLTFEEESIHAVSIGSGHCYGLNLCGASKMEFKGYDYQEILNFYFPKLEMKKIYS